MDFCMENDLCDEVFGATPKTARGTRALLETVTMRFVRSSICRIFLRISRGIIQGQK
jgi:hypothetical protein